MSKVLELFGASTSSKGLNWKGLVDEQFCPYLSKRCIKVRKSRPDISIGTCSVSYGTAKDPVMICPFRVLERKQIFTDCIHLLTTHEVGNELHIVPEISVPGGSVDYFLASVKNRKVKDFVGVELQTLDTTGTVWPERQRFLKEVGLKVERRSAESHKGFGMNWKMTAKTILVQLHHKIQTFEHVNKHLALAVQDSLLKYMRKEFKFSHLNQARIGDPMHIHSYKMSIEVDGTFRLDLDSRWSTDTNGIGVCLGLRAEPKVELQDLITLLEAKISHETLFVLNAR
jgi:hypothetical protein